ncbi:MAG: transglutaminase family protein [Bryobacterales bacterium]|nr:transglutaminase family protein [Bryobacterales bacterium]
MAIRVALHHRTAYKYDRLVGLSPQTIRLRPAPHCRTPITAYSLKVEPKPHFLNWQQDPQSNFMARVVFPEQVRNFSVDVDLVAEMTVINPFDFFLEPYAEKFPFRYDPWLERELAPFREAGPAGPELAAYLKAVNLSEQRSMDFLVALNQKLQQRIRYLIRMEPGVQSCEESLTLGSGSCRDSAWLLVEILRHLGLAARFVSGYLIQLKPDLKPLDGQPGPSQDFTDLHAWTEVYLPGAGWIGLDPTSGLLAGEGHIPLAATPEPGSAAPISGAVDYSEVTFAHEMSVTRIHEDPRVTLPYTDAQWQSIQALGCRVDQDICASDIRLTMGGEPTFISIDHMDGAEWNTDALGAEKRKLAEDLLERLRARLAPGGLLHYGQGKWYPGEPLPRWALACYWRADGVPLWQDRSLLAQEKSGRGCSPFEARSFTEALARRLGLAPAFVIPAFEDAFYYLQKERQLPVNVDSSDSKLPDAIERERLRQVFEHSLDVPVAFVLPVEPTARQNGSKWQSSAWPLRGEKLMLMSGDSPIGLRLPLFSLPYMAPDDAPLDLPADPMDDRGPLPIPRRFFPVDLPGSQAQNQSKADRKLAAGESAPWVVRKALCVETREGRLHVFMPPLTEAEDYVELLAAVEDTAAYLEMPVVIEGYPPPADRRLQQVKVTPDPGVIEVNVQPAANWQDLVANTTELYDDARQSRLGAEKFMLDGRHTGTGGGNHFVLGGPTPADSPFLRRPDLLRSMIAYWLNHPSLSYAFSSIFIGPTSQAPRVDETRADSLYELEIAFNQIPRPEQGPVPGWLVDRIFRNLLVDVTGNTHRAEFCIDKLYAPDSATGRLGLLELRGFEMPPHARMSLTQQLLVRALVAWFWKDPYLERPIHWGTRLHDEFMLPHFASQDFRDVLRNLKRAGYEFEAEWFAPHFEFRYPILGQVHQAGIDIELRQATEPWYVLGEEGGGAGTARYVDSSVERLQVKTQGLTEERYVISCNGRRLPLHSTGKHGEWVAGVRYRAWQPPSCLHPTIPVQAPLIFDVVDIRSGRSIGGCSYHVSHPGGRTFDTFPVNANEAEARRASRFFPFGHTGGAMGVPPAEQNPEYPLTLDLRRPPPSAADAPL